jgi:phosphate transport system substrate-binding protein
MQTRCARAGVSGGAGEKPAQWLPGTPPPQVGSVQLKGSETLRPLLTMCAEDFMARHPHIDVMVQGGGSGTGIAALLQGTVDIGMASRALSDKEQQYAARRGLEVRTFDVALDGIAVVVHADNPVETLTLEQLREIFTGNLQSWQDVGGVPQTIIVLSRMAGSGTAELFRQRCRRSGLWRDGADAHQRGDCHRHDVATMGHWVYGVWGSTGGARPGQAGAAASQSTSVTRCPHA